MTLTLKAQVLKNVPTTATALYTNGTGQTQTMKNMILSQTNPSPTVTTGATAKTYAPGWMDWPQNDTTGTGNWMCLAQGSYRTVQISATSCVLIYWVNEEAPNTAFALPGSTIFCGMQVITYDNVNDRYSSGPITYQMFNLSTSYGYNLALSLLNACILPTSNILVISDDQNVYSYQVTDYSINKIGVTYVGYTGAIAVAPVSSNRIIVGTLDSGGTGCFVSAYNVPSTGSPSNIGTGISYTSWVNGGSVKCLRLVAAQLGSTTKYFIAMNIVTNQVIYWNGFNYVDATQTCSFGTTGNTQNSVTMTQPTGQTNGLELFSLSTGSADYFVVAALGGAGSAGAIGLAQATSDSGGALTYKTYVALNGSNASNSGMSAAICNSNVAFLGYSSVTPGSPASHISVYRSAGNVTTATWSPAFRTGGYSCAGDLICLPFNDRIAYVPTSTNWAAGYGYPGTGDALISSYIVSNTTRVKYVPLGRPDMRKLRWNATYSCWCAASGNFVYYLDSSFNQIGYERIATNPQQFATAIDVLPNGNVVVGSTASTVTTSCRMSNSLSGYLAVWTPTKTATGSTPTFIGSTTTPLGGNATDCPLDICVLSTSAIAVVGNRGGNTSWMRIWNAILSNTTYDAAIATSTAGSNAQMAFHVYHAVRMSDTNVHVAYTDKNTGNQYWSKYTGTWTTPAAISYTIGLPYTECVAIDRYSFWHTLLMSGVGLFVYGPGPTNLTYSDTTTAPLPSGFCGGVRIGSTGVICYSVATSSTNYTRIVDPWGNTGTTLQTGVTGYNSSYSVPWVEMPNPSNFTYQIKTGAVDQIWTWGGNVATTAKVTISNGANTLVPYPSISLAIGATRETTTPIFVPAGETVYVTAGAANQIDAYAQVLERT